MANESVTPRTDEKVKIVRLTVDCVELPENHMVNADFARQLEAELANSEKKVFAYKTALEQSESELIDARAQIERLKIIKAEQSESLKEARACIKRYGAELSGERAKIERLRAVSEHRKAIMLVIADSLENNKLTDEEEYEDELIESLRSNAEEKAALSAAERGE